MTNGYIEYASKEYVGQQLENKADATHNHDSSYDMKGASDAALKSAKSYADEIVDTACSNITLSDLGITATADELNYVDGASSNIQGQLDVITDSKADWNQTDETAIDYIKNKPFGTNYEVGDLVISSILSTLYYNGSYYYIRVAQNIPYYSDTYDIFTYMGYVEIDGKSFLYITSNPFYKSLYMYFVFNQGTDQYYDVYIRGDQSDLSEIQSKSANIYTASTINNPLSINLGGTGCTSIADTTYTTARYRASSLHSSETTPTINGTITWTHE